LSSAWPGPARCSEGVTRPRTVALRPSSSTRRSYCGLAWPTAAQGFAPAPWCHESRRDQTAGAREARSQSSCWVKAGWRCRARTRLWWCRTIAVRASPCGGFCSLRASSETLPRRRGPRPRLPPRRLHPSRVQLRQRPRAPRRVFPSEAAPGARRAPPSRAADRRRTPMSRHPARLRAAPRKARHVQGNRRRAGSRAQFFDVPSAIEPVFGDTLDFRPVH
jgi:hypothetical protein